MWFSILIQYLWISNTILILDLANTFVCDDGKILDASKQCDDFPDCDYGEDERDCQYDEEPINDETEDENNDVEEEVIGINF